MKELITAVLTDANLRDEDALQEVVVEKNQFDPWAN